MIYCCLPYSPHLGPLSPILITLVSSWSFNATLLPQSLCLFPQPRTYMLCLQLIMWLSLPFLQASSKRLPFLSRGNRASQSRAQTLEPNCLDLNPGTSSFLICKTGMIIIVPIIVGLLRELWELIYVKYLVPGIQVSHYYYVSCYYDCCCYYILQAHY